MILVDFCGIWFLATRIRFIEADPDPADENETDPYPKHWSQGLAIALFSE